MAYNNGFPVGYAQSYPPPPQSQGQQYPPPPQAQPYPPPQLQQQVQQSSLIWVQGEAGAKSYLLAPNTTMPLWDAEAQVIYLKSTDASGMPSMKVLDYTVRDNLNLPPKAPVPEGVEYATKDEVKNTKDDIKHQIDVIKKDNNDIKKQIDDIKESLGIE